MDRFDNPFHDLWITEILAPGDFVKMFSPKVAENAEEIFGAGNVVIKGTQGSGKSMLLGLLSTQTRIAYARSGESYPRNKESARPFISAEINLVRSNVRIVAARLNELPEEMRRNWAATTFADYINYVLSDNLLKNVLLLAKEQTVDQVLANELPISLTDENKKNLVQYLRESPAWFGFLSDCTCLDSVIQKITSRLTEYRKYFNFNANTLNPDVENTKTDIGEPIADLAEALRRYGIIPDNTLVFLRVDQHEELYELEKATENAQVFRRVLNRALAMRDSRVSYRIGTRHYAWESEKSIWGSGAELENMRDYSIVNIDQMLRRGENPKTAKNFEHFAEDAFKRRLSCYGFKIVDEIDNDLLENVFGNTLTPSDRALHYAKGSIPKLSIPENWAPEWKTALDSLWKENPLSAKLGEAWLRQRIQQKSEAHLNSELANTSPWEAETKEYWRKERNEAALMQIAGATHQNLIWAGSKHIVQLSGSNILAFMTICRSIWAAWLRYVSDEELRQTELPKIKLDEQVVGIYEASRVWYEKLKEGAEGEKRIQFIRTLGSWFARTLRKDLALSNPGHNGISLTEGEFGIENFITALIKTCRDHGDLIESPHTTKLSDALPRVKWYLHPLLSPYFGIPHVRTKEPIYTNTIELKLVYENDIPKTRLSNDSDNNRQASLF